MPNDKSNTPYMSNSAAIENLCCLMRDLETLGAELLATEEATGQPIGAHQAPLTDRLGHAGVSSQKIEDFMEWRRSLSNLISSNPQVDVPRIATVEQVGLTLLDELIAAVRAKNSQIAAWKATGTAVAA
jgi:hypothetical protein